MRFPILMENKSHVPNHQPEVIQPDTARQCRENLTEVGTIDHFARGTIWLILLSRIPLWWGHRNQLHFWRYGHTPLQNAPECIAIRSLHLLRPIICFTLSLHWIRFFPCDHQNAEGAPALLITRRPNQKINAPCLPAPSFLSLTLLPIGSMYGIYANIGGILMVNVTIYSIHGSYGLYMSIAHTASCDTNGCCESCTRLAMHLPKVHFIIHQRDSVPAKSPHLAT